MGNNNCLDIESLHISKNWVNGSGQHPGKYTCLSVDNTSVSDKNLSDKEWVYVDSKLRSKIYDYLNAMGKFGVITFLHEISS